MLNFLRPPQYVDIEQTQAALTFDSVAWATIFIVTGLLIPVAIVNPLASARAVVTIATVDAIVIGTMVISHRGWTRAASWILVIGLLVRVTYNAIDQGGLDSPGLTGFFVFPLMAAVLLGEWEAFTMAVICCGLILAFVVMGGRGLLPPRSITFTPTALWLIRSIYLGLTLWLVRLAIHPKAAALRRAQEELAARLETERAREQSERHRQELENQLRQSQKMEALGTLAGGIAHDFNNILMAILGNAALAMEDIGENPARAYLDEIAQAGERGAGLVKRILLFSRRGESAARRPIAIGSAVSESIALLRTNKPAAVQITASFAPDLPTVLADATQLHQVFINLGTNAIHAMRAEGGVLEFAVDTVTYATVNESPLALGAGRYVRIVVRDTGAGISADIAKRLFEPFFTTKGVEGTGLGLSVAHGIIRDHDGAITVTSEPGQGSTFTIYLPATSEPAAASALAAPPIARGHGEHIMYVDDEEPLVFLMTQILERQGYRCTGYSSPEQALDAFRRDPDGFDAVITDLTMPNLTGVELAERLRTIRPGLRIAIASGFGHSALVVAARRVADVRIPKPATPEDISVAMVTLLS